MMILKELFREPGDVCWLPDDARIIDAAEVMRREKIGSLVIQDQNGVIGILTDRDIALGVTLGAATPHSLVTELMTRDVEMVPETMTLFELTRHFRAVGLKRLPVVDDQGHLMGIVSVDDVMSVLSREMFDTCRSLELKLGHAV